VVLRVEAIIWDRDVEDFNAECWLKDDRPNARGAWIDGPRSLSASHSLGCRSHDPSAG